MQPGCRRTQGVSSIHRKGAACKRQTGLRDLQDESLHAPKSPEILCCKICKRYGGGSSVQGKAQCRNKRKQQDDLRAEEML